MRRREFISLLGGAAAWPLAARAQQTSKMRRIGILFGFANDSDGQERLAAFRDELPRLGWDERNLRTDLRWATGDTERTQSTVKEFIAAAPDLIFASPATMVRVLRQHTSTIPIVFVQSGDPVRAGSVSSHARPGGNATGFMLFEPSINTKYLQLLKDIAPGVKRAAIVQNPDNTSWRDDMAQIESVARSLEVIPELMPVRDRADVERALAIFAAEPNGGVIVPPDNTTLRQRDAIIEMAAKHRLPAVYAARIFVANGGLMSYSTNQPDIYRRAASYVDRILRGEKPGDLPVQAPTKFELLINLKAARTLGLDVPLAMLARADEVIE